MRTPSTQIIDIQPSASPSSSTSENLKPSLSYVPEWLAILQQTQSQLSLQREQRDVQAENLTDLVEKQRQRFSQEENNAQAAVTSTQILLPTAPSLKESLNGPDGPPPWYTNPQTVALSSRLGIENNINAPPKQPSAPIVAPTIAPAQAAAPAPKVESAVSDSDEIQRIREAAAARKRKREEANSATQSATHEKLTGAADSDAVPS